MDTATALRFGQHVEVAEPFYFDPEISGPRYIWTRARFSRYERRGTVLVWKRWTLGTCTGRTADRWVKVRYRACDVRPALPNRHARATVTSTASEGVRPSPC